MFDSHAGGDIPVAEAILDVHPNVHKTVEAANRATQDAVFAAIASRDPMAAATFGAKQHNLEAVANARKSMLNTVFMTGVPTFALRLDDTTANGMLGSKRDADACLRLALSNLADQVMPKTPVHASDPTSIASATSIFSLLADVRSKITLANRAVHQAVVTMLEYREQMAPIVFGVQANHLELFANTSGPMLESALSCGIALFSLRLASDAFSSVLGPKGDANACFRLLLDTFAEPISITSL